MINCGFRPAGQEADRNASLLDPIALHFWHLERLEQVHITRCCRLFESDSGDGKIVDFRNVAASRDVRKRPAEPLRRAASGTGTGHRSTGIKAGTGRGYRAASGRANPPGAAARAGALVAGKRRTPV